MSAVFDVLDPRKHRKQVTKFTNVKISEELRFEDFVKEHPEKLSYFFEVDQLP